MIYGFDKFEGQYIKIIGDFNETVLIATFDYMRVQKVDDNFYFLLGYLNSATNLTFRYKPNQQRLPALAAILLKKADYTMNVKGDDGKYSKIVVKSCPLEVEIIEEFEKNVDLYLSGKTFRALVNLNQTQWSSLQDIQNGTPISTGMLNMTEIQGNYDLPNTELKQASSKSSSKSNNTSNSTPKQPLTSVEAWYIYQEAIILANQAFDLMSAKMPNDIEQSDKETLKLGLFFHLLSNR
jgi:hypothetical protein